MATQLQEGNYTIVQGPDRWKLSQAVFSNRNPLHPELMYFVTKDGKRDCYLYFQVHTVHVVDMFRDVYKFEGIVIHDGKPGGNGFPGIQPAWDRDPWYRVSIEYCLSKKSGTITLHEEWKKKKK